MPTPRAIERSFPIVQVNPLSVRERNAFKPVYTMHKWFARRSSSIFRAILLGAALPAEDEQGRPLDWMAEFYRGHGDDPRLRRPDGAPLRVLDPFMGGGTTVVEALRLGLDVTGLDLNPVAWFIVRGETTPVDLRALDAAFQRVADKVRQPLLDLYRTRCPLTGQPADIIYGFWVKQGVCVAPDCGGVTDLFKSYVVGRIQGDLGLYYLPDVKCPGCSATFDWELERCTITAGGPQVLGANPVGISRPAGTLYAFGLLEDGVDCPSCGHHLRSTELPGKAKRAKKKVLVQAILDPSTGQIFEVRGAVPARVTAPASGHEFAPEEAPVQSAGKFRCACCGRLQAIVESADRLGRPLPFRYYGYYAYSAAAEAQEKTRAARERGLPTNNHKWFAAVGPEDLRRIEEAQAELSRVRADLPLPEQEIPEGRNFRDLRRQGYRRWSDLYGPRQLLALGRLLRAIGEEPDPVLRDALLGAFQNSVNYSSFLCRFHLKNAKIESVTSAHDYRNPTSCVENAIWGIGAGQGAYANTFQKYMDGLRYREEPDLPLPAGFTRVDDEPPAKWRMRISRGSATDLDYPTASFDLIITDPPYAGSVQYAEMSDWSYVWLHQILKDAYPEEFGPEITLKAQEIIENNADKDRNFFFEQLTLAWRECHRVLRDDGLLVFTFHHKEGDRWSGLLQSLFDAGFYLVAAYPTHSEALNSIVIQATEGITYDIVHVCRKRLGAPEPIPWTRLRREVLSEARAQLKEIEGGKDVLPGPDVRMILLGKALMRFSQHYGAVLDADGGPLADLAEAIERISLLVREVRGEELPLPGALQDVDSLSQAAFLHVVGRGPWSRDDLHKELRGFAHGLDRLLQDGLVREARGARGRLEAVPALERGAALAERPASAEIPLIDRLHRLLHALARGQDPAPLVRGWSGDREILREGLGWLGKKDPAAREWVALGLRALDAVPVEAPKAAPQQQALFGRRS